MASKSVTDREKSSRVVESAAREYAQQIAEVLSGWLASELDGEAPPIDLGALPLTLATVLERRRVRMVDADDAHVTELSDDRDPRRRRDAAAAELHDRLLEVRKATEVLFGPGKGGALLAIEGKLGIDPVVVRRYGRRVVAQLSAPALVATPASLPGVDVDPSAWVARIEEPLVRLEEALDEVDRERRKSAATLGTKKVAVAAYDETFIRVAELLEALARAAGLLDLAARVRPSRRRPGRTADGEPAEGEPNGTPVGPGAPGTEVTAKPA